MGNRIKEEFENKKEPVRLNKYLSEAGICSRREADKLIAAGKITVDGERAEMGMRVIPGKQEIRMGKKVISKKDEMVVLLSLIHIFPGISLPVGKDKKGLPIGMQLIGDGFQEKKLIRAAYTYDCLLYTSRCV